MVTQSLNNSSFLHNPSVAQAAHSNLPSSNPQLTPAMRESLRAIQGLGLTIKIRRNWVWVYGANASHQKQLEAAGFKWSYKRSVKQTVWYLPPSPPKQGYRRDIVMEKTQACGSQAA